MPTLAHYTQFTGRHWETGTVANALAYQGVKVPQTRQPFSEAMLLGISGGAAFGYFTFDYKGYDPHVALLSRNTFDPMTTLFERLGIAQDVYQTSNPKTGEQNLIDVLEGGRPAIVWADIFSLPYNRLPADKNWWGMLPCLVFGYENGQAHLADRSGQPLTVTADELMRARARVKDDKFRVIALNAPDMKKLPSAIQQGIWQCIALYTEKPPKGARDNFGLAAYQKWAAMLTNTRNKQSWERFFPPGSRMFAAIAGGYGQPGAFGWACTAPANMVDDRMLYGQFLDEAALILSRPKLKAAGEQFRASSVAWRDLAQAMLPEEAPLFKEVREIALRKRDLFINQGLAAVAEIEALNTRFHAIKAEVKTKFPLTNDAAAALRERMAEHVLRIHDIEKHAIDLLRSAMA
jgi:hypothetical protein